MDLNSAMKQQERVLRVVTRPEQVPDHNEALQLANETDTKMLADIAATLRDAGHRNLVTYSRKVFIPLTHLCRDVCHYCTFAQTPKHLSAPYMTIEQILDVAHRGAAFGCKEALFTLGEKPELRYRAARHALDEMGYSSTIEYLREAARLVYEETGLLPHLNPGTMSTDEIEMLRPVAPSMGIMLETSSQRLSGKGMPHYGSPDKHPGARLTTIEGAGKARIPLTSGILIGIGETRRERIESLLALRDLHLAYGHLQEIIIQNFRAKPNTKMSASPEPDLDDLLWTIAVARIVFGPQMNIQAPPNLSAGVLTQIISAGINDWGGVSPLTPDYVNPEAPWPHLDDLARETAVAGKHLQERLTIYPEYACDAKVWTDVAWHTPLIRLIDTAGFPRTGDWAPGTNCSPPVNVRTSIFVSPAAVSDDIAEIIDKAKHGTALDEKEIVRMFQSLGDDYEAVVNAADSLRREVNGDTVTYAVNRNINYTNVCYFHCKFCAFSKGKTSEDLRGAPYNLSSDEIQRRTREAWDNGATEVCMQGGIHPSYTGETYLEILRAVKRAVPQIHVHAFSPLEVWQGATTLGMRLEDYLVCLKDAGLASLPGTAAEILDDEIRSIICPDKISTDEWLEVMETAHSVGLRSTATIMFGHVERPTNWARHILRIRELQSRSGGFTEFVPLPFVHMEAPMYMRGVARKGPTWTESILMHAVARLALHPLIQNIQVSWVKMGHAGAIACLNSGCNDLGGTLMNESISRAAGAAHGQETPPAKMHELIETAGRVAKQRNTLYGDVSLARFSAGMNAGQLQEIYNTPISGRTLKQQCAAAVRRC
jgi:FO synthase